MWLQSASVLTWTAAQVLQWDLWKRGITVILVMLGNVSVALIWTWILIMAISYGNVFTGHSPGHQSYGVFMSGTMMWIQLFFCLLTLAGQSAVLVKNQFLLPTGPTRPQRFPFCFRYLLRRTYGLLLLSVGTPVAMDIAIDYASPQVREWRLEFYINCILSGAYLTAVHLRRRHIYLTQTVAGVSSQSSRAGSTSTDKRHRRRKARHFCRVFLMQNLPLLFSTAIAGIFVQVTSMLHIATERDLLLYAVGSLTFKLAIQELARMVIASQKSTKDTRTIFLTVGLPTVLIDTQIRLAMQRLDNVRVTMSGAVALSLVEVLARWGKVLYLRYQFRRHKVSRGRRHNAQGNAPTAVTITDSEDAAWRQLHLRYHAAEVYADMSAEYIAIGSCAPMLYYYWDHPHYQLGNTKNANEELQWNQPLIWVIQIGLEVVVDYISVVLEMAGGIPFEELHRFRLFITLLFLVIGLLNVQNTAVFYLLQSG